MSVRMTTALRPLAVPGTMPHPRRIVETDAKS